MGLADTHTHRHNKVLSIEKRVGIKIEARKDISQKKLESRSHWTQREREEGVRFIYLGTKG
jgi:hypothetical protein